jgi:hypothetical protein
VKFTVIPWLSLVDVDTKEQSKQWNPHINQTSWKSSTKRLPEG